MTDPGIEAHLLGPFRRMSADSRLARREIRVVALAAAQSFRCGSSRIFTGTTCCFAMDQNACYEELTSSVSLRKVVFANNTVSGLFVVIGLAVADLNVCLAGLLGASLATLTGVVIADTLLFK